MSITSRLTAGTVLPVLALLWSVPATAHPHVWVTVRDVVVVENGQISGVQHEWAFDDMYTAMAIEGLDKNKDGKYSREELQELAQINIDGLKEFENFTYANIAGMKVLFGAPKDYYLEHDSNLLRLHFFLPLVNSVPVTTPHFKVTVTDPSYFIGFEFDKDSPVKLAKGAPGNCTAALAKEKESPDQKDLNQAFAAQMAPMGGGASNTFEVACKQ